MIERHFIKVFGTTYMVEIETLEKVENKVEWGCCGGCIWLGLIKKYHNWIASRMFSSISIIISGIQSNTL